MTAGERFQESAIFFYEKAFSRRLCHMAFMMNHGYWVAPTIIRAL
jgi:hypothetical protein